MAFKVENLASHAGRWFALSALLLAGCDNFTFFRGETPVRESRLAAPVQPIGDTEATAAQSGVPGDIKITLLSDAVEYVNAPFVVNVTVSADHIPMRAQDFLVSNGAVEGFAPTSTGYRMSVRAAADGVVEISVAPGVVRGLDGGTNKIAASLARIMDATPPAVTMEWVPAGTPPAESARIVPVIVTVNESHVPLTPGDFTVANGTITSFVALPGSYTFDVVTSSVLDVPVSVKLPAGKVRDQAGNGNPSVVEISRNYRRVEVASGTVPAKVTVNLNHVWVVDKTGKTSRILLDEAQNYPMIEWKGSKPAGGHRTFVSPVGLIIGKTGGRIYRVDDDVKDDDVKEATGNFYGTIQQIFDLSRNGKWPADRVCVTAFKAPSTGHEYIGAGYSSRRSSLQKSVPLVFSASEPRTANLPKASNKEVWQTRLYDATTGETVPSGQWSYTSESVVRIEPSAFRQDASYKIDYRTKPVSDADLNYRRLFTRIPIDKKLPTKINASAAVEFDAGPGGSPASLESWGYSCYTDQGRNVYWSKGGVQTGNILGIDMLSGEPVPLANAANRTVTIVDKVLNFNLSANQQSYALAGGGAGILLSAASGYTSAYETSSNLVFMSFRSQPAPYQLMVGKGECFTGEKASCSSAIPTPIPNSQDIPSTDIVRIGVAVPFGPLSSLNDGRVVGIVRPGPSGPDISRVYLLRPLARGNPSAGLEVKEIKSIPGDAYMYTDFTGATTYADTKEITIDLKSRPGFRAGDDFGQPEVQWHSEAPAGDRWRGLTMSIRCFKGGEVPPAYQVINNVAASGAWSPVNIASCSGFYDQVGIKLEGNGEADFSRVSTVEFRARQ